MMLHSGRSMYRGLCCDDVVKEVRGGEPCVEIAKAAELVTSYHGQQANVQADT
jgi:hypothetical protein